jgi:membrane protein
LDLLKRALKEWGEDKAPKQAAALAYYSVFALGPLLLVCVLVAALAVGREAAQQAILAPFARLTGDAGAQAAGDILHGAGPRGSSLVGIATGAVALVLGAMGVFTQLKEALNTVFEVARKPRRGLRAKIRGAVRDDALSFAGVMTGAFLLAVTLVVSAGIAALAGWIDALLPGGAALGIALEAVLALIVLTLLFAALFKLVPDVRIAWRDSFVGGAATAILFVAGQALIGVYLGRSGFAARYGGAGAALLILLWIYYSSLILVFGAELTQVYANLYGRRVKPAPNARSLQEQVLDEHRGPDREGTEGRPVSRRRPAT